MTGWIITFFVLTLCAGIMGFAGLAGSFDQIAQFFTVVFVLLFVASIFYSIIIRRNSHVPLP